MNGGFHASDSLITTASTNLICASESSSIIWYEKIVRFIPTKPSLFCWEHAHCEIEEQGYHLDSVLIDTLYPNGDLDVSTLIAAPDDDPNALPSCYGTQRFRRTTAGLLAEAQHQFTCE